MKLVKFTLTPPIVAISVALFAALSSFGADVQKYIEYVQTDVDNKNVGEYVLLDYTPTADSVVEIDHAMQQYATPCFFCSRGNAEDADTFTLIYSGGYRWDYNRVSSERHVANKLIRNRFCFSGARTPARLPVRVRTQTG